MWDKVASEGHRVPHSGQDVSGSTVSGQPTQPPPPVEPLSMKTEKGT